ncbi:hypothetical protein SprV_0401574700 [Sparganum proliferum]
MPGPHELGGCNSKRLLLLRTGAECHILLTNTFSRFLTREDASSIALPANSTLLSYPEARSTGHADDKGDQRRRWLEGSPPRRLQAEAFAAASQETTG